MQPIVYDVAVSVDGYIAGPDGDLSALPFEGAIADDYLARLGTYRTTIMGRATYEFGMRYGMTLGANPYPQARTIVVSRSLWLPEDAEVEVMPSVDEADLDLIRERSLSPVYLCGGGTFAAHVLALGRIDLLRLKRAPILLGGGVPLFETFAAPRHLVLTEQQDYSNGTLFQEFRIAAA